MNEDKFFYPATAETIHKYASSIFSPIRHGECVSTVWVPMAGRRMWNKFLIENIALFEKELPGYQKYLLVYVEPLDLTEETLTGYLRLLGKGFLDECRKRDDCRKKIAPEFFAIFDDETASYGKLLEVLKQCFTRAVEAGHEVVLFLGEFDELTFANGLFYNNLKSLWEGLLPKLHYVFLSVTDFSTSQMTGKLGELNAATLQNVVYVPIRGGRDLDYLIDFFANRSEYKFSENEKTMIKEVCGGHPYLIKAATRIISSEGGEGEGAGDLKGKLMSHYELLSVATRTFDLRTAGEKEVMEKIVAGQRIEPSADLSRLLKLGLAVRNEKGEYGLFGELITSYVKSLQGGAVPVSAKVGNGLSLNDKGEIVGSDDLPVDERFTGQEYNVMKFLLGDPGKLRSRDEIGEALWGGESYEKYSDWAIDQVMSKIRKKLREMETKTQLVTIRGRGYKLGL